MIDRKTSSARNADLLEAFLLYVELVKLSAVIATAESSSAASTKSRPSSEPTTGSMEAAKNRGSQKG